MYSYICKNCGCTFNSPEKNRVFCGYTCRSEKRKKDSFIELICDKCGKKFLRKKCRINQKKKLGIKSKFCSKSCSVSFLKTGVLHSEETKHKMSLSAMGKNTWSKGRHGNNGSFKKGQFAKEKHPNWKGGITGERNKEHGTDEYKNWRKSVFERDNYKCQWCGKRGGKLIADHIKPYYKFKKQRLLLSNGRTLCSNCDKKRTSVQMKVIWKNQIRESKQR